MKRIDRYILLQFFRNFLFALLCFIIIFVIVDLFENLDKFLDNKLNPGFVFNYYLNFTPEIIKLITPIAVLLSTLFTVGRLINYNEIIAIKNAGVSLIRFMLPLIAAGVLLTAILIYFNNWIVPMANKKKFYIERNFLKKNREQVSLSKLYFQDAKNRLILIEQFKEIDTSAVKVNILLFREDSATVLSKRIDVEKMKWVNGKWNLINATERIFVNGKEEMKIYSETELSSIDGMKQINLVPQQIFKKQLRPDEMNYSEIDDFIDSQIKGGQNIDKILVDFYSKISFPFSTLIVIVFGVSISTSSKKRKGLALQFGISILVSFIYLGFVKISQTFGYNGDLNPLFTAWLANILFASFGVTNLLIRNY